MLKLLLNSVLAGSAVVAAFRNLNPLGPSGALGSTSASPGHSRAASQQATLLLLSLVVDGLEAIMSRSGGCILLQHASRYAEIIVILPLCCIRQQLSRVCDCNIFSP